MKELTDPIVADLPQGGKRGFRGNCTEVWLRLQRLQNLRCSHRFSETKDAVGPLTILYPVEPTPDIVFLQQSVGCQVSPAGPMIAGIRHHDAVAMLQKNLGISGHPKPVVTHAMQKKNSIVRAVFIPDWAKAPGTKNRSVPGLNGDILKVRIELFGA